MRGGVGEEGRGERREGRDKAAKKGRDAEKKCRNAGERKGLYKRFIHSGQYLKYLSTYTLFRYAHNSTLNKTLYALVMYP